MTKLGMLIETDKCIGCSGCLKSCKDEYIGNAYPPYSAAQPTPGYSVSPSTWPYQGSNLTMVVSHGQNWMEYSEVVKGTFPDIKMRYVYQPCMQCDNAPCQAAATNNAITTRADGIVLIDPQKSTNQAQLPGSCPYGRIYWNSATSIAQKCTFCAHLVDQGKNPRCVDACPVSAITFGDISDPNSAISKKISSLNAQPLNPEFGTKPKVYYSGLI
jgi:tetrathionate reductase subunit B